MARLARIALLMALVPTIALPTTATAAPPDDEQSDIAVLTHELLTRLWEPFSRLFGTSDAQGGPDSDPNGFAGRGHGPAPLPSSTSGTSSNGESDGGPNSDPDGFAGSDHGAAPPPSTSGTGGNPESDGGPNSDPDG